ncbi:hypothetical protein K9U34_02395 [Lawsonia intracellularis]|uniref:NA n=1 Tax=Lawsonia intracellularis (strain PHE/MN1-00) TaxID=363253 RepID=Q1MS65_LAWIP|nr:hypothetical protein [Lawsonia intracellularis]AGC49504.1 hypothetical protein LAW_00103 [Lawsonia intracellularis N343]KAA0205025.1 hypothetical protein C4K43_00755 [Lawsonia intracellularis]MBZ3892449.1 hypothetical protein [Lawsonia intracellularis]OMQ06166.1 hypothetical protein BW722_00590 [Lawsonia intracellularis]RBN32426.1 hypothetical protein DR194_05620 [Lawsonia intracellularis]
MKSWFVIFLGIILLLYYPFIGVGKQTPRNSLLKIQYAIDSHNFELFEEYVDINGLLNQGVEYFFCSLTTVKDTSKLPSLLYLLANTIQVPQYAAQVRSLFISELYLFIKYGISSGLFAGHELLDEPTGLLTPYISKISLGRKELLFSNSEKVLAKMYKQKRDIVVPIQIKDYGNGRQYPVLLGMSFCNGMWKVTTIKNLPELCKKFEEEYLHN